MSAEKTLRSATRQSEGARANAPSLAARLAREIEGEVRFDAFTRGRYSTDASHYQIEPLGVVVPRSAADLGRAIEIAGEADVSVLPRGAGTSQCGQTVGAGLVIDTSRHLDRIIAFSPDERRITVEPGMVLDRLNAFLRPHRLHFPVDVSTSSRATIGGMAGNNSCGARSIRYGTMRANVLSIDAVLANGASARFGLVTPEALAEDTTLGALARDLLALGRENATEIAKRFPKLQRRVGGYNIDALATNEPVNLSHLLVGSEGTLACSTAIELALSPLPAHRVLGVCHFPSFRAAMEATPRIVALEPGAVELVDRTMIELSRDIALFRSTVERFVRGEPDALLLVEFAGEDADAQRRGLRRLVELMADLGHPGAVVEAIDPMFQKAIWEVRKAGLNIMMSMKGDGKPISFIEDCAVPLEDLADYTDRLTRVFRRHGTEGTWYAHASEGCLHVRPVLNLKLEADARKMRAIAEEAFAMVREYKGSHSGEHGDGLVRSEFHEAMFGGAMVRAFERVKDLFDPEGRFNPGKIVRPPRMDERTLFRFPPGYAPLPIETALDWSAWGGFAGAAEMCNNNGACRALGAGVMCPSFRATREEKDLTRGRANTLRLALSGQLGPDALTSDAMAETMRLCVGCKACRRECPAGVDMARMKIEVSHHHARRHGLRLHERLVALAPALCTAGGESGAASQPARPPPRRGRLERAPARVQRAAPPARVAARSLPEPGTGRRPARWTRGGALRRHLQPLVRARDGGRRARGARRRRLSRAPAGRARGRTPALLRPHLPLRRSGRRSPAGGAPRARYAGRLRPSRNPDSRARALLPVHPARRVPGRAAGRRDAGARGPGPCCSRSSCLRRARRAA